MVGLENSRDSERYDPGGFSSETPPGSSGHPNVEILNLTWILGVMQWCALAFALFSGAAFVLLEDLAIGLTGVVIFAFFVFTAAAKIYLKEDNLLTVVISIYVAMLVACSNVLLLLPSLHSTLALTALLAVAFALPYTNKRVLRVLMATSFLASITVVLVGTLLVARKEGQPVPLLDLVFSTSTLAAAVALAMLVLGQFRTRLVGSLEQTRLAEEQSRFEATHDFLTGLPNRALLEQRLGEWLSSIKNDVADRRLDHEILKTTPNSDSTLAVLFLDLDRFKYVNDSLGHHIGDELLQVVAKRISSCIRPQEGDLLSRLGGDEFVLVICSPQPETAVAVASHVQEALKRPIKLHGHELYATVSIGILPDCSGYDTPGEILRDADTAMYISKESEGLNFAVFEPSMRAKAISRLRLETDLRRAVDQREFVVHYQPTVWLATGGVVGFETSLKWSHTERDLLTPDHFMPLAQEIGLGYDLDRILLKAACEKAALWRENFPEHFPPLISVSLSTDAFFRKSLTEDISDLLSESKISGHALMIGVPERTISERPEESLIMLERLRSLDIRLAVDGFKKGLSSLEFLHRLPVEALKIDSPVTSPVENGRTKNQDHLEVTQTVLTVAHEFGMEVLVRGVETREQMRELCDMECDHAQGAYFSRPVDAQNAEAILTAEPSW